MRPSRRRLAWHFPLLIILAAGCGKLGPPEAFPSSRVVGKVHVNAIPVAGGWIEFLPINGARGHLRSAPIDPDGRFELTRVANGTNAVRLIRAKSPIPVGRVFEQFHTSPIRRTIGPGARVEIDVNLADEARRLGQPGSPRN